MPTRTGPGASYQYQTQSLFFSLSRVSFGCSSASGLQGASIRGSPGQRSARMLRCLGRITYQIRDHVSRAPPHTAHRPHQLTLLAHLAGLLISPSAGCISTYQMPCGLHLHAAVIAAPGICAVCCEPGSSCLHFRYYTPATGSRLRLSSKRLRSSRALMPPGCTPAARTKRSSSSAPKATI